nr:uncharacterized protein LOC117683551 isoform X1 [Crassostrea gigas]
MNPSFGILLCLAIFSVVEIGQCRSYRIGLPRSECIFFRCAAPPKNCRTEVVYDDGCPETCKLVCECPTPTAESLEICENPKPNPLCYVEKDFIMLADGKMCFNGCMGLCEM